MNSMYVIIALIFWIGIGRITRAYLLSQWNMPAPETEVLAHILARAGYLYTKMIIGK